jgi:hypothetical protein
MNADLIVHEEEEEKAAIEQSESSVEDVNEESGRIRDERDQ